MFFKGFPNINYKNIEVSKIFLKNIQNLLYKIIIFHMFFDV